MTTFRDRKALDEAGALPVPMTRKQLLGHVAKHFSQQGTAIFTAPLQIEYMKLADLRAASTSGHIFSEIEKALGTAGITTNGTMGSVMDPLGFSPAHVHCFCSCHAEDISGWTAAMVFRSFEHNA